VNQVPTCTVNFILQTGMIVQPTLSTGHRCTFNIVLVL
jgi:hypothetical protein